MAESKQARATAIVQDAGGEIVGRTRLQKIGYLMDLAGFETGFTFEYRHYGPFSEDLAQGIQLAGAFNLVEEEERPTEWGGFYSVYRAQGAREHPSDADRSRFASAAREMGAVVLELAATAAYLASEEGHRDPWEETARRKPDKAADGRLAKAKQAYRRLQGLRAPQRLPDIA